MAALLQLDCMISLEAIYPYFFWSVSAVQCTSKKSYKGLQLAYSWRKVHQQYKVLYKPNSFYFCSTVTATTITATAYCCSESCLPRALVCVVCNKEACMRLIHYQRQLQCAVVVRMYSSSTLDQ
eukprot:19766-Heterococcus_DN1.PRE.2